MDKIIIIIAVIWLAISILITTVALFNMIIICFYDGINWFDYNPDMYDYSNTRFYKKYKLHKNEKLGRNKC